MAHLLYERHTTLIATHRRASGAHLVAAPQAAQDLVAAAHGGMKLLQHPCERIFTPHFWVRRFPGDLRPREVARIAFLLPDVARVGSVQLIVLLAALELCLGIQSPMHTGLPQHNLGVRMMAFKVVLCRKSAACNVNVAGSITTIYHPALRWTAGECITVGTDLPRVHAQ